MSRRFVAFTLSVLTATLLICTPGARAQELPAPDVPADFDLVAAMKGLFGNYDPVHRTSAVTLDNQDDGKGLYAVGAFYLHGYNDSGKRYMLMATGAIPTFVDTFNCHACTPLVRAAQ